MTLAEHDALLKREGRHEQMVEARRQRDEELRRIKEELRQAQAPLLDELRRTGFEVDSVWDLVNTSTPYPEALPILVKHLERPYPDRVREGIARAVAVRDGRFAWEALVRLFCQEPVDSDTKQGLAAALAAAAADDVIDELIELARNSQYGESRVLLLSALKRSKAPQARAALEEFAADLVLGQEAQRLLGRR